VVPTEPTESELGLGLKIAAYAEFPLFFALYGSMILGFAFASRLAALVALVAFTVTLAVHIGMSAVYYRQVMRREWPKVAPLADDDDWDAA
jgi:hypothetical protein